MTPAPHDAPGTGQAPLAVRSALGQLTRRAEFLAAARARRHVAASMLVQARKRTECSVDGSEIRVGFTCSKKVGNAVMRNRAKRRLREAARCVLPTQGRPGWDYVLIGKHGTTISRRFDLLVADLEASIARLHGGKP